MRRRRARTQMRAEAVAASKGWMTLRDGVATQAPKVKSEEHVTMGILAPPAWQPAITERTDRATIAARLRRLNREAMDISRRGHVGTRSADYEVRHATLNMLLCHWQMAQL